MPDGVESPIIALASRNLLFCRAKIMHKWKKKALFGVWDQTFSSISFLWKTIYLSYGPKTPDNDSWTKERSAAYGSSSFTTMGFDITSILIQDWV